MSYTFITLPQDNVWSKPPQNMDSKLHQRHLFLSTYESFTIKPFYDTRTQCPNNNLGKFNICFKTVHKKQPHMLKLLAAAADLTHLWIRVTCEFSIITFNVGALLTSPIQTGHATHSPSPMLDLRPVSLQSLHGTGLPRFLHGSHFVSPWNPTYIHTSGTNLSKAVVFLRKCLCYSWSLKLYKKDLTYIRPWKNLIFWNIVKKIHVI
jgi:hypothetical protein